MSDNHTSIINSALRSNYGVSYAGAYARCMDAGMRKEDAEFGIGVLVQNLSLGRAVKDHPDTSRVHSILSHPAGKTSPNA